MTSFECPLPIEEDHNIPSTDTVLLYMAGLATADELFDAEVSEQTPTSSYSPIPSHYRRMIQYADTVSMEYPSVDELTSELLLHPQPERQAEIKNQLTMRQLKFAAWFVRRTMGIVNASEYTKETEHRSRRQQNQGDVKRLRGNYIPFIDQLSPLNIDFDDRMQIAVMGLMKSLETYSGQMKLSTQMFKRMESEALRRYDELTRIGKIPEKQRIVHRRIVGLIRDAENAGSKPNIHQIAFIVGGNAKTIEENVDKIIAFERVTPSMYADYLEQRQVDDYTGSMPDDPLTMADYVADEAQELAFTDLAEKVGLSEVIDDLLGSLKPRQREVIELRFGFDGKGPRTLEEIGKQLGITRERVRQIQDEAIEKLRRPNCTRVLEKFVDNDDSSRGQIRDSLPALFGFEDKYDLFVKPSFDREIL